MHQKKQVFGSHSKESLSDLVLDKTVNVETKKRDRYGRQIGKVLVNGQDANMVQVERGMAWFYRQYQREQSTQRPQTVRGGRRRSQSWKAGFVARY